MSLITLPTAWVRTDLESGRGAATRGRAAGRDAGAARSAAAGRALATIVAFIAGLRRSAAIRAHGVQGGVAAGAGGESSETRRSAGLQAARRLAGNRVLVCRVSGGRAGGRNAAGLQAPRKHSPAAARGGAKPSASGRCCYFGEFVRRAAQIARSIARAVLRGGARGRSKCGLRRSERPVARQIDCCRELGRSPSTALPPAPQGGGNGAAARKFA